MTSREQDKSRIVSVRLPDELIRRLDRYLDWSAISGRVKSSRNAALREALRTWLEDRFDAVLEGLRADRHLELDHAKPGETHATDIHDSDVVHGHLSLLLRWCE